MNKKLRMGSAVLVLLCILTMSITTAAQAGMVQDSNLPGVNGGGTGDASEARDYIEQVQQQRETTERGYALNAFSNQEKLVAGVYPAGETFTPDESVTINGTDCKFWTNVENAVDDIVTVKNVSTDEETLSFVRTVFAFPVFSDGQTHLYLNFHKPENVENLEGILTEISGQKYMLYVYNYDTQLEPGATTEPSLLQYVFDKEVTTAQFDEFGNNYRVLITSQAVQVNGFSSLADAFGVAFSNVTANSHPWTEN